MTSPPPECPHPMTTLLELLEHGESVFVHVDPRAEGVVVPEHLRDELPLVLQLGYRLPIPTDDVETYMDRWEATLSFGRQPFGCVVPWKAVWAFVLDGGGAFVFVGTIPDEWRASYGLPRSAPRVLAESSPPSKEPAPSAPGLRLIRGGKA